jgi:hypothetical protein
MKYIGIVFIVICSTFQVQAQFKAGGNIGLPVGDFSDAYKVSLGLDIYRMFGDSPDSFLKFGATTGFLYYGDDPGGGGGFKDAALIPVAGAVRVTILSTITAGPDIGYAFALDDLDLFEDKNGGFYYRLVAGIDLGNSIELNLFYHSISIGVNVSSVGLGVLYEF